MRNEIQQVIDNLIESRRQIRLLIDQTYEFEDDQCDNLIGERVDLRHAESDLNRVISFVNRLLVNGKKPWDVEVAQ